MYELFDEPPAWEGLDSEEDEEPEEDQPEEPGEFPEEEQIPLVEPDFEDMEVTWSLWAEEPGFDQMMDMASDWLSTPDVGFFDRYSIFPVNISD